MWGSSLEVKQSTGYERNTCAWSNLVNIHGYSSLGANVWLCQSWLKCENAGTIQYAMYHERCLARITHHEDKRSRYPGPALGSTSRNKSARFRVDFKPLALCCNFFSGRSYINSTSHWPGAWVNAELAPLRANIKNMNVIKTTLQGTRFIRTGFPSEPATIPNLLVRFSVAPSSRPFYIKNRHP